MKRAISLFLICVLIVSLVACAKEENGESDMSQNIEKEETETISSTKSDGITVEQLSEMLEGLWVDIDSAELLGYEPGYGFNYCIFNDGRRAIGVHPGGMGRDGNIVEVSELANGYRVKFHYPAGVYFEDPVPEEFETVDIKIDGKEIIFNNEPTGYTYVGYGIDDPDVTANIAEIKGENPTWAPPIPHISTSARFLGVSLDSLRNAVSVRSDTQEGGFYKNSAAYYFFLKNLGNVTFYRPSSGDGPYFGVQNGQVVICATNNYSAAQNVLSLMPNNQIPPEPLQYTFTANGAQQTVYLWEVDNGYMAITTFKNDSVPYYKHMVQTVAFVSSLDFLSYYYAK